MIVVTPAEAAMSGGCIVCQGAIDRNTQTMAIDTLYDFDLPGHPADGRKYICQGCVQDMVRACGLMQANEVATLKDELSSFRLAYTALLDNLRTSSKEQNVYLDQLPVLPNVNYANPSSLVIQAEEVENAKPKRGRPQKEPSF